MTDSTAWTAIAFVLTALGATWTYLAWQRRGATAALRGVAWTLLPLAAWMTGTLELFADVAGDVSRWAAHLVFSPVVWLGVIVAGISVVLFGVSGALKQRGIGTRGVPAAEPRSRRDPATKRPKQVKAKQPKQPGDDDMDDIDAILKRHGIS